MHMYMHNIVIIRNKYITCACIPLMFLIYRPDGVANKNGTWVVSGPQDARKKAKELLLHTCSSVYEFGDDVGAANVVMLIYVCIPSPIF